MQAVKIFMKYPNYFCVNNDHIFIDFDQDNFKYLNELHPASIRKIHVFITSHVAINDTLKTMIDKFGGFHKDSSKRIARVVLHIPKKINNLKELANKFLENYKNKYTLYVEPKGVYFAIKSRVAHPQFYVLYTDISIQTKILGGRKGRGIVKINFLEWFYEDQTKNDTIFETPEMRLTPDLFKDKLISAFKEKCPPGILKSFPTDDDIWDYIVQQGEWKSNIEGSDNV